MKYSNKGYFKSVELKRQEAERIAEEKRREMARLATLEMERKLREERERKQREETFRDGTEEFAKIKVFFDRYIGKNFYIEGSFYPNYLKRNRERKCFSVAFASKGGAVVDGPYEDQLAFIATEAMGEKLLNIRGANSFDAIIYVNIRFLDETNKKYPVGYINKIDFQTVDLKVLKKYISITITDDGKDTVHSNPYKK